MTRTWPIFLGVAVVLGIAGIVAAQLDTGGNGDNGQGGLDGLGGLGRLLGGGGFGGGRGGGRGGRGGFGGGGGGFGGGGYFGGGDGDNNGREFLNGNEPMRPLPADRDGVPKWNVDPNFKSDVFTFVRLKFTTDMSKRGRYGRGGGAPTSWLNDWASGDLDLSFRLQQLTALKVDPDPIQLEITDPKLFNYPFAYMLNVGALTFSEEEVRALRRWCLNGGFLMVDDHWGEAEHENWNEQIARVFPDRQPIPLPLSHPIFHSVFDLKKLPQVATLQMWNPAQPDRTAHPGTGGPGYWAIQDDQQRIMVLEDWNTDTSDGWERETNNETYFDQVSVKWAYPFTINVIFYAMTH